MGAADKRRELFLLIYLSCYPLFTGIYVCEMLDNVPAQMRYVFDRAWL
jgi:hypothetical protein